MDDVTTTPAPVEVSTEPPAPAALPDDAPWQPYREQLRATWGGTDAEFAAAWQQILPQLDAAYTDGMAQITADTNRRQAAAAPVIAVSIQAPPELAAATRAAEARRVAAERKAAQDELIARYIPPGYVRIPDDPPIYDLSADHPDSDTAYWRKHYATRYRMHPQEVQGNTKAEMAANAAALDHRRRHGTPQPSTVEQFIPPGYVPMVEAGAGPDPTAMETYIQPGYVRMPEDPGPQRRNHKGQWTG